MEKTLKLVFNMNEETTISFFDLLENLKTFLWIIGGYDIKNIDEESIIDNWEVNNEEKNVLFIKDNLSNNDFEIVIEKCLKYSREYNFSFKKIFI